MEESWFDSRSYPILLLEELQEGACRYLAAAVRQQEAGARDLVVLEQEDAGLRWRLQRERRMATWADRKGLSKMARIERLSNRSSSTW